MTNFTGAFLTVQDHGCVYTICTEGELFAAPILSNGSVNFDEFDVVNYCDAVDNGTEEELNQIQDALVDMMKRIGLYFQVA